MTENFNFFLPLTKVEKNKDGSVTVSGYASTPALDLDGEVVSLEAIKAALPGYWEWRNIRQMHQPSAVGVAKEATVDAKGLFLTSRITDKEAAQKCLDGVYKGYSIGGRKLSKTGNTITEIDLVEISVVDRPANPECRIEVAKRAKDGGGGYLVKSRLNLNPQARALRKMAQVVETLAKEGPPAARDGLSLPAPTKCAAHGAIDCKKCAKAARKASGACKMHGIVGCTDCAQTTEKRELSTEQRRSAASSGAALPDGSFPIKTKEDLSNARQAVGRAKNPGKARAHIKSRAAALGVKLPPTWSKKEARGMIADAEAKSSSVRVRRQSPFLTLGAGTRPLGLGKGETSDLGHGSELGRGGGPLQKGGLEFLTLKSMNSVKTLASAFDMIRSAQRSLVSEAEREGGDKKDKALAKQLGQVAKELAVVIGQKAEHEGGEALDLSDADDRWLTSTLGEDFEMAANGDDLTKAIANVLKAGKTPTRMERMTAARGNLKKARKAANEMQECIKSAHGVLKAAYLAKDALVKAGKKPKDDGDADDMDVMGKVMGELNKAFGTAQSMKTFIKAASGQLKKASGRSGQRGQEVSDGESGVYEVPPGIRDLSPAALAGASPGTPGSSGGQPPMYPVDGGVYPGKSARKGAQVFTEAEANLIARTAAAEARVEILERMPIGRPDGRRPVAFDMNKALGTQDSAAPIKNLLDGVDVRAIGSGDESAHTTASANIIGNYLTKGNFAKSIMDPEFRGAVAGVKGN